MRTLGSLALLVLVTVAMPRTARAQAAAVSIVAAPTEAPSTGVGLEITGGILTGLGVVNLITSTICYSDFYARAVYGMRSAQDTCFYASIIIGGVLTAVGVPLLVLGLRQHGRYRDWRRSHGLAGLGFFAGPGGGGLTWAVNF